jgi:curli biogenesis system outer membrane secretion channel CsgG
MNTKGIVIVSINMLVLLLLAGSALAGPQLRYRVFVDRFENRADEEYTWGGYGIGSGWSMVLQDQLVQADRFTVLQNDGISQGKSEDQLNRELAMAFLTGRAPVTQETTQESDNRSKAEVLVNGTIVRVTRGSKSGSGGITLKGITLGGGGKGSEVQVNVNMVDAKTGIVLASQTIVGKSSGSGMSVSFQQDGLSGAFGGEKRDDVAKACEDAIVQAVAFLTANVDQVPWSGSVVSVNGSQVYIDRGSRDGVANGQRFTVGEIELLKDDATGEILDKVMHKQGELEVVEVKDKVAICKLSNGKSVSKGMSVMQP